MSETLKARLSSLFAAALPPVPAPVVEARQDKSPGLPANKHLDNMDAENLAKINWYGRAKPPEPLGKGQWDTHPSAGILDPAHTPGHTPGFTGPMATAMKKQLTKGTTPTNKIDWTRPDAAARYDARIAAEKSAQVRVRSELMGSPKPHPRDLGMNGGQLFHPRPNGSLDDDASKMVPDSAQAVENIVKVLNQATPEEMAYQKDWYRHMHKMIVSMSQRYGVPVPVVAGVVAVLSPGLSPRDNLDAAERVLARKWDAEIPSKNGSFLAKAIAILGKWDIRGEIKGPKVSIFWASCADPEAVQHRAVLDGHAFNIWRGKAVPIAGAAIPDRWRTQMEQDYATAGKRFGLSAQEAQAVSWYVWRIMVQKDAVIDDFDIRTHFERPSRSMAGMTPNIQGTTVSDGRYPEPPNFMRRSNESQEPAPAAPAAPAKSLGLLLREALKKS